MHTIMVSKNLGRRRRQIFRILVWQKEKDIHHSSIKTHILAIKHKCVKTQVKPKVKLDIVRPALKILQSHLLTFKPMKRLILCLLEGDLKTLEDLWKHFDSR